MNKEYNWNVTTTNFFGVKFTEDFMIENQVTYTITVAIFGVELSAKWTK